MATDRAAAPPARDGSAPSLSATYSPGRPVDVRATLGPLRRGGGDPTNRVDSAGWWRTARTPLGPATQLLSVAPSGALTSRAWGPGASWLLETLPELLGERDDTAPEFEPLSALHPLVRDTWRRHPGWRVPRGNLVLEALVPSILEQKVTGGEARSSWRWLVRRYGEPAPGPAPAGLRVVPTPRQWALVPSWAWHQAGVGPDRSRTIAGAAGRAGGLERTLGVTNAEADTRLRSLPGIGAWTSAEVRQRAHGDPDAVSVGDFHLAGQVVYALTGRTGGDDDAMLELLEPYAGHRYRVVRMIELAGVTQPRRGPRYAPLDHRGR
jgi:3-methyladenine DNA glycosylase/8-oxoguanine DNA glycosylase